MSSQPPRQSTAARTQGAKPTSGVKPGAGKRGGRSDALGHGKDAVRAEAGPMTKIVAKANRRQAQSSPEQKPSKAKPKTRINKKGLVLYVEPEVTIALRRLALDTGSSVQALGAEALDLLFAKHGVATRATAGETST